MALPTVLDAAHRYATAPLSGGDVAVDATVGNGHDTLVLARAVGAAGRVFGFDIQAEAHRRTCSLLADSEVDAEIELIHDGHQHLATRLPDAACGHVGAVMFNLGYLPGHTSDCMTRPDTTVAALEDAVEVLRPDGRVTIVLYTGHEGGKAEAEAVDEWAAAQPQERLHVLSFEYVNQVNDPPRLLVVEKRGVDA